MIHTGMVFQPGMNVKREREHFRGDKRKTKENQCLINVINLNFDIMIFFYF